MGRSVERADLGHIDSVCKIWKQQNLALLSENTRVRLRINTQPRLGRCSFYISIFLVELIFKPHKQLTALANFLITPYKVKTETGFIYAEYKFNKNYGCKMF